MSEGTLYIEATDHSWAVSFVPNTLARMDPPVPIPWKGRGPASVSPRVGRPRGSDSTGHAGNSACTATSRSIPCTSRRSRANATASNEAGWILRLTRRYYDRCGSLT